MLELREYVDEAGISRHSRWIDSLDPSAKARVVVAIRRLSLGNLSNVKGVGQGVSELKLNFGPGFRVYFGRDGERLVLLLGGGTKQRQQQDIALAQQSWRAYKLRKAAGALTWH